MYDGIITYIICFHIIHNRRNVVAVVDHSLNTIYSLNWSLVVIYETLDLIRKRQPEPYTPNLLNAIFCSEKLERFFLVQRTVVFDIWSVFKTKILKMLSCCHVWRVWLRFSRCWTYFCWFEVSYLFKKDSQCYQLFRVAIKGANSCFESG